MSAAAGAKSTRLVIALVFFLGVGAGVGAGLHIARSGIEGPGDPALPELPPLPGGGPATAAPGAAPFREYPIGEVEKNSMRIAAVWLPPVRLEGDKETPSGEHVIHLEADVAALRGNPNGFGLGEWIPYLTIDYRITDDKDRPVLNGRFSPMVAGDGPHYGATIPMPGPGRYKLTYAIQPPSAAGFGRHCDPVTGVEAWWSAFEVRFDWDYKP